MRNGSEYIRRELMIRLVRAFDSANPADEIDHIPVRLRPRNMKSSRCCIYHDREVLKYRIMALLGTACENEEDEIKPPSSYLDAPQRSDAPLSVCAAGCSGCPDSQYLVTGNCRGCFARPCLYSCPKGAIKVENQISRIDYDKCIKCGKCQTACPFNAIIKTTVPCEESCPVGAIRKNDCGTAEIDFSLCIFCGKCFEKCPFGAIMELSQLISVLKEIRDGNELVAMVAPAAENQFPGNMAQLFAAIRGLGFTDAMEVALGAEKTITHEAEELCEKISAGQSLMTTSCCPAYVELVRKHLPDLQDKVSSTPSPMIYASRMAKEKYPNAKTVFIGPCIAKRYEARISNEVDYVLSFEEIGGMLAGRGIDIIAEENTELPAQATQDARNFAHSNGVSGAVMTELSKTCPEMKIHAQALDGIDKKSIALLKAYGMGKMPVNFLEVMACRGGCVNGPCSLTKT